MNFENYKVLLIGVGEFVNEPEIHPIPNVKTNLKQLEGVFLDKKLMGIPSKNITISLNEEKLAIGKKLNKFIKDSKKEDTLIIYYTGHGILNITNDLDLYLTTNQTELDEYLEITSIKATFFKNAIKNAKTKKRIIILDCCFSGKIHDTLGTLQNQVQSQIQKNSITGTCIISSSDEFTPSLFDDTNPESPTKFTGHLVNAMKEGINNGGKYFSIGELYSKVKELIDEDNLPPPQHSGLEEGYKLIFSKNLYPSEKNEPAQEMIVKKKVEPEVVEKKVEPKFTNSREYYDSLFADEGESKSLKDSNLILDLSEKKENNEVESLEEVIERIKKKKEKQVHQELVPFLIKLKPYFTSFNRFYIYLITGTFIVFKIIQQFTLFEKMGFINSFLSSVWFYVIVILGIILILYSLFADYLDRHFSLEKQLEFINDDLGILNKNIGRTKGELYKLMELIVINKKEIQRNKNHYDKATEVGRSKVAELKKSKLETLIEANFLFENKYKSGEIYYRLLTRLYEDLEILLEKGKVNLDSLKLKIKAKVTSNKFSDEYRILAINLEQIKGIRKAVDFIRKSERGISNKNTIGLFEILVNNNIEVQEGMIKNIRKL